MRISQSLIKEVIKNDHCPKQIYYSFIEGKELIDPSENMLLGRYFESELLGCCRGGVKQKARTLLNGNKSKPFSDCDDLVVYANEVLKSIGIDVSKGESQVDMLSELLSGAIDHVNQDLENPEILANYDVKWTATKEDDQWNGWGDPETKSDAKIQATHYTLVTYEATGEWRPFYFLVFGKDNWVKVLRFKITPEAIEQHKELIAFTAQKIREYAVKEYKGNGNYNKCTACPFKDICSDRTEKPEIETIII